MTAIRTAIRAMIKDQVKPEIYLGKVIDFDDAKNLATIELNIGAKLTKVRIRSVINNEESGIFVIPKNNSYVLVGVIEQKLEAAFIIAFSEIIKYRLKTDLIELNGDSFGGIAKVEEIENNLNAIKSYLDVLNSAIYSGINAVGVSTAASGPIGAGAYQSAMAGQNIIFTDMANPKVKHG